MKLKKHDQSGGTQTFIVRYYCSFVDSCNFTDKEGHTGGILVVRDWFWLSTSIYSEKPIGR